MSQRPNKLVPAGAVVAATREFVERVLTEAATRGELSGSTTPERLAVRVELLAALVLVLNRHDDLSWLSKLLEPRDATRH